MSEYIVEFSEWVIDVNGNPPFGKGEEIVRCRDCEHFGAYGSIFGRCAFHDIGCSKWRYCAWGERKEVNR